MRINIVIVLLLLWANLAFSQHVVFPESFKAGVALFPGMQPAQIDANFTKKTGLTAPSGVLTDPKIIEHIADLPSNTANIKRAYYEIYQGKTDKSDDAGIVIVEFKRKEDVIRIMPNIHQDNVEHVRKDNFLIFIWSDESRGSQKTLDRLATHYQQKLGTKYIALKTAPTNNWEEDSVYVVSAVPEEAPYEEPTTTESAKEEENRSELELEHRAYKLMQEKEFEKAVTAYKKVIDKNPKNERAYYNIVWMYATSDQNLKAIEESNRALEAVSPGKKYQYYRFIGTCLTDLNEYYEGMQYFQKAQKLAPKDALTIYNYGFNRFKAKDFQRAIDLLISALKIPSEVLGKKGDIYFYIGTSYSEIENYPMALLYLDSAIAITPYESYYANKAHIYNQQGDFDKAIKTCDEGIRKNSKSGVLYFKRHQLKKDINQVSSAQQDLRKAYELEPNNPEILLDMGVLLSDDNRTEEALELYRKAITLSPEEGAGIYGNMANIFSKNQLTIDSAHYYYKKSIATNTKAFQSYFNYANMLKDLHNYPEAEKYYRIADERKPNHESVMTNLAFTLYLQDKKEEALKISKRACELYPNDYEINMLLARIYFAVEKNYPMAEQHSSIAIQNLKPGKSSIIGYSIRANARMMTGAYQNAISDYLEIINRLGPNSLAENYELFTNIGYSYLYLHEYQNAEIYLKKCLEYKDDVDAYIGLALVAQANNQPKELAKYKKLAIKKYPKLKKGEEGIKALEAEDYYYNPTVRAQIISIFGR